MNKVKKYRQISHTADVGIKVWGQSLEELFKNAVKGMVSIVLDRAFDKKDEHIEIELSAPDNEDLLVDFLNEMLYKINVDNWIPSKADIQVKDNELKGKIFGGKLRPDQEIAVEIKAATYHNIEIKKEEQYNTVIYFDV